MILNELTSEGKRRTLEVTKTLFRISSSGSDPSYLYNISPVGLYNGFIAATTRTFLPTGFPDAVRPEYLAYQFWDSLQALCSYLRSVLTIQAVLTSAGVGSAEASALSTTLTWVIKDGVGMLGSLMFAYWFADVFEVNVKEWRLVADILNNFALTLDLFLPLYPSYYLQLTCVSSICKSCCGLVAGATRARISAHFAQKGHLADVTAKESTQETAVTLMGLMIGFVCTKYIGDSSEISWILFFALMAIHQVANYKLIRTLVLDTLNTQRIYLIVQYVEVQLKMRGKVRSSEHSLVKIMASTEETVIGATMLTIPTPALIAASESIYRPIWLSFCGPQHAVSLSTLFKGIQSMTRVASLDDTYRDLRNAWKGQDFLVAIDSFGRPITCLNENCNEEESVKAYTISCYLMHRWSIEKIITNALKIEYILNDGAILSLKWYNEHIHSRGLENFGWDTSDGSSRLGGDGFRISSSCLCYDDRKESKKLS